MPNPAMMKFFEYAHLPEKLQIVSGFWMKVFLLKIRLLQNFLPNLVVLVLVIF